MGYHETVEELARGQFGAREVTRVSVSEDDDWDGDRVLDIVVVWDDSLSGFNVNSAADFKRELRAILYEEDHSLFPVVSFLAKSEDVEIA